MTIFSHPPVETERATSLLKIPHWFACTTKKVVFLLRFLWRTLCRRHKETRSVMLVL
jgi:hypothetical protein